MLAHFSLFAASTTSLPATDHFWLIVGFVAMIYFAPALTAFFRHQQNRWFILALNFLFGWTLVGWIICLAWAARAPSGEPVIVVQTVPEFRSGSIASFGPGASDIFTALTSNTSEGAAFQNDGAVIFPGRRPHSIKLFLLRLTVAVIALAVVAGVTASQWKPSSPGPFTSALPKRIHHVPQIRNIDPYMPAAPNATPQRHYPSPLPRSHEGYY